MPGPVSGSTGPAWIASGCRARSAGPRALRGLRVGAGPGQRCFLSPRVEALLGPDAHVPCCWTQVGLRAQDSAGHMASCSPASVVKALQPPLVVVPKVTAKYGNRVPLTTAVSANVPFSPFVLYGLPRGRAAGILSEERSLLTLLFQKRTVLMGPSHLSGRCSLAGGPMSLQGSATPAPASEHQCLPLAR